MTAPLSIITVVLRLPEPARGVLVRAKAIVLSVDGNGYFPNVGPLLAAVNAAIVALDEAEVAASSRTKGAAQLRNGKLRDLIAALNHLRDHVQGIAETSPDDALAIVGSASMYVKGRRGRSKPELAARQGRVSGEVVLDGRAAGGPATYYWQWSTDQEAWNDLPDTSGSKTGVAGLTPGQTYFFRYASMRKSVRGDWSQIVGLRML